LLSKPFRWIKDANALLTNGVTGKGNCSLAVIKIRPGKIYRFRIINAGTMVISWAKTNNDVLMLRQGYLGFAIANHSMTIVEVEGQLTKPYVVDHLEINTGQRYSVLVAASQNPAFNYLMQSKVRYRHTGPSNGLAILQYGACRKKKTSAAPVIPPESAGWILNHLEPRCHKKTRRFARRKPDRILTLVGSQIIVDGYVKWAVNGLSFKAPSKSLLLHQYDGTIASLPPETRPIASFSKGDLVDLVLINTVERALPFDDRITAVMMIM
jgi:L-ascorbate oxidase